MLGEIQEGRAMIAKRRFHFSKQTVDSYIVREWHGSTLVDKRTMNADQVGKREGELVREGFRLYTERNTRCYVLDY